MAKIKTSELEGAALDWAVASYAEHFDAYPKEGGGFEIQRTQVDDFLEVGTEYSPSTDWSQGGPLIEWYHVDVESCPWSAYYGRKTMHGDSPLIAACRAIVAAKLGDVVEVPDELA